MNDADTTQQRAEFGKVWDALVAASHGRGMQGRELATVVAAWLPTPTFLEAAIRHLLPPRARERYERFRALASWAAVMQGTPLGLQEYLAVLPQDTHFDVTIPEALERSGWLRGQLRRIEEGQPNAVPDLIAALQQCATEASHLLAQLEVIRSRILHPLHILQVQTLTRAALAVGSFDKLRILEVGSYDGGLLLELRRLGADVVGMDLEPRVESARVLKGDFLQVDPPGSYDMIVATSVFEAGSSMIQGVEPDTRTHTPEVLRRLHQFTQPGGHVVLENLALPLPFTAAQAVAAGFEVLPDRVFGINLPLGGRGCTLRRR